MLNGNAGDESKPKISGLLIVARSGYGHSAYYHDLLDKKKNIYIPHMWAETLETAPILIP